MKYLKCKYCGSILKAMPIIASATDWKKDSPLSTEKSKINFGTKSRIIDMIEEVIIHPEAIEEREACLTSFIGEPSSTVNSFLFNLGRLVGDPSLDLGDVDSSIYGGKGHYEVEYAFEETGEEEFKKIANLILSNISPVMLFENGKGRDADGTSKECVLDIDFLEPAIEEYCEITGKKPGRLRFLELLVFEVPLKLVNTEVDAVEKIITLNFDYSINIKRVKFGR